MPLDEIEFARALNRVRIELKQLDNSALQDVLDTLLDLIESTQDHLAEILNSDDE
jgi:hypothetical protein